MTNVTFLAPTGAQGVTMSVCLSVCPAQLSHKDSILTFLAEIFKLTSHGIQTDLQPTSSRIQVVISILQADLQKHYSIAFRVYDCLNIDQV